MKIIRDVNICVNFKNLKRSFKFMKKFLAILLVLTFTLIPLAVSAQIDLVNELININIYKAASTPVIDGKLDAEAYKKIDASAADFLVYGGDDEYDAYMSANLPEAYISYDANNLYVFLIGDASKYYFCDHDADSAGDIWNQSCIQISVSPNNTIASGGERLEIGLARNSATGEQISNIWAQGSDSYGKDDYEMVAGSNYGIVLEGGKLAYEVSIPWTTFLEAAPGAGTVFGFNFIYGWSDPDLANRFGVEYSAGCCNGKTAELFAQVKVLDELTYVAPAAPPEPEPEPAAPEEPAAPAPAPAPAPAVPTGNTGIIALASVMVIAAAGIVVFRKKAVK